MVFNQALQAVGLGNMSGNNQEQSLGTRTPAYKGRQGYPRTLKETDLFNGSTVDVSGDKFELLGYFTVGAKQFAEVGQGDPTLDPAEQGRPRIEIQDDTSTTLEGSIRLTHESAQGTQEFKIVEDTVDAFDAANRSDRLVLSRASVDGYPRVGEDSKIGLYFNASTTGSGVVSRSNSTVRLPVTIYE